MDAKAQGVAADTPPPKPRTSFQGGRLPVAEGSSRPTRRRRNLARPSTEAASRSQKVRTRFARPKKPACLSQKAPKGFACP